MISSACTRICSMSASFVIGWVPALSSAAASSSSLRSAALPALTRWAMTKSAPPTSTKGMSGIPGMNAMPIAAPPAIMRALRDCVSCPDAALPRSSSAFERVTMMPVETAMSSAGIWVTRPSPMVSRA
jgi:hypothetical protein